MKHGVYLERQRAQQRASAEDQQTIQDLQDKLATVEDELATERAEKKECADQLELYNGTVSITCWKFWVGVLVVFVAGSTMGTMRWVAVLGGRKAIKILIF